MPEQDAYINSFGSGGARGGVFVNGGVVAFEDEAQWKNFNYTFTANTTTTRIALDFVQLDRLDGQTNKREEKIAESPAVC